MLLHRLTSSERAKDHAQKGNCQGQCGDSVRESRARANKPDGRFDHVGSSIEEDNQRQDPRHLISF